MTLEEKQIEIVEVGLECGVMREECGVGSWKLEVGSWKLTIVRNV